MSHPVSHHFWRLWLVGSLALAALGISLYLAWISGHDGELAGCGGSSTLDCDHVLTTRWSRWLGIPVSYPAILTYVVIVIASVTCRLSNQTLRGGSEAVLMLASLLAAGASLWFMLLQLLVIGKFCLYCSACHLCGFVIVTLVLWPTRGRGRWQPAVASQVPARARATGGQPGQRCEHDVGQPRFRPLYLATAAGIGILALIVGQVMVGPKTFAIGDAKDFVNKEGSHLISPPTSGHPADPTELGGGLTSPRVEPRDGDNLPSVNDLVIRRGFPPDRVDGGPIASPAGSSGSRNTIGDGGRRQLTLADGRVTIDAGMHPLLGSLQAKHIAVMLFDYTCPECRKMFGQLEQARVRYRDQLAIVVLPIPLDTLCNPYIKQTRRSHAEDCQYVRLALAVWHQDRSKFEAYHRWLMTGRDAPPLADAVARAQRLLGPDKLQMAVRSSDVAERIEQYVRLYDATGKWLPFILIEGKAIRGYLGRASELFGFLERYLGFAPAVP